MQISIVIGKPLAVSNQPSAFSQTRSVDGTPNLSGRKERSLAAKQREKSLILIRVHSRNSRLTVLGLTDC
jgi:hypothetical protein